MVECARCGEQSSEGERCDWCDNFLLLVTVPVETEFKPVIEAEDLLSRPPIEPIRPVRHTPSKSMPGKAAIYSGLAAGYIGSMVAAFFWLQFDFPYALPIDVILIHVAVYAGVLMLCINISKSYGILAITFLIVLQFVFFCSLSFFLAGQFADRFADASSLMQVLFSPFISFFLLWDVFRGVILIHFEPTSVFTGVIWLIAYFVGGLAFNVFFIIGFAISWFLLDPTR